MLVALSVALFASVETRIASGQYSLVFADPEGWRKFFYDMGQQLFVAIILGAMVYEIIERSAAKRMAEKEEGAFRSTLAAGIQSAFSTFYDEGLIAKITDSLFATPFIRRNFSVTYRLAPLKKFPDFCALEMGFSFDLHNAGKVTATHPVNAMVSSTFANYIMDTKPCPKILNCSIDDKALSDKQLESLNRKLSPDRSVTTVEIGKYVLNPGEKLSVKCTILSFKRICDSETFRGNFPSADAEISVKNDTNRNLAVGISPIGDYDLPDLEIDRLDRLRFRSKTDDAMLPHFGWVVFWNDRDRFSKNACAQDVPTTDPASRLIV